MNSRYQGRSSMKVVAAQNAFEAGFQLACSSGEKGRRYSVYTACVGAVNHASAATAPESDGRRSSLRLAAAAADSVVRSARTSALPDARVLLRRSKNNSAPPPATTNHCCCCCHRRCESGFANCALPPRRLRSCLKKLA